MPELSLPPLSLYIHLPWCVKKCPYCDFNSHASPDAIPAKEYITALIADLEQDLPLVWGRPVHSVFFGGGTPSLFSAEQIGEILGAVRGRLNLVPGAEITLEANPGTIEHDSFAAYREAGINRVSLGVQSFSAAALRRLGRIHGRQEIHQAIASLCDAGLENFNLDLMYGLPQQTTAEAIADIDAALQYGPCHISHYQLTLEPNTAFFAQPPALPTEDACWQMQEACAERLAAGGFEQYEISAWALPGERCAHNLNYWRFGDYLGIGAGAHGKITLPAQAAIMRLSKKRHPKAYLQATEGGDFRSAEHPVAVAELAFEFFLNQLRLREGVRIADFEPRTGLGWQQVGKPVALACSKGLLKERSGRLLPTELGWRFVNETQALFLPATASPESS